ncbi:DinB/UmuC family translesion DNA polymerase [Streptomyces zaomyceticus]|uniref:DinB/UmuC family translesion DNA polymerase n=1 Tax=Streptomyces zaomyceticus TaxID=68286 RepID=UPI0016742673|nr:hypothetical protein [Streptomyces zaomyceticus]GHG41903.1 hypothetical protein GCM10018791_70300 [Streptomyces zaomyceticus]
MDETVVCRVLGGKAWRTLRDRARGIDPRAVTARRMPESTSAFHAFDHDVYDPVLVRAALLDLVTALGQRIRGRDQIARELTLAVRFADGSTVERTRTLPQPSAHTDDLRATVFRILDSMAFERARIRRLLVTVEDRRPAGEGPGTQTSLDPAGRTGFPWSPSSTASTPGTAAASPGQPVPTAKRVDPQRHGSGRHRVPPGPGPGP